jgi:hypothetical protein
MLHLILLLVISFGAVAVNAQSFPSVKEFTAPPFPPAALAVRASGIVQVAVFVNSIGQVVSAESVSGHPLLRAAARTAAIKWTFSQVPGSHFIVLRFVFDLPTRRSKASAVLSDGTYTLRLTEEMPRIEQVVSY